MDSPFALNFRAYLLLKEGRGGQKVFPELAGRPTGGPSALGVGERADLASVGQGGWTEVDMK